MPIRPENKPKYPKDWSEISKRIRERAGNRCEKCGRPNGEPVLVSPDGAWCLYLKERWTDADGQPTVARDETLCHATKTILTVAHLDHDPANCAEENLRAWCQRCHLSYDAKHHASTARKTRSRKAGQGELPGVE